MTSIGLTGAGANGDCHGRSGIDPELHKRPAFFSELGTSYELMALLIAPPLFPPSMVYSVGCARKSG